jgi:hypothetical protein
MPTHLSRLIITFFLLASATVTFADTTIIYAGELLATPGKAASNLVPPLTRHLY